MRISFDVDDTLVLHDPGLPAEMVVPWWWRWRYHELLRLGTKALLHALQVRGHELLIYAASYRQPRYMRGWFKSFGVRLAEVVNQDRHDQLVKPAQFPGYVPSKYPPAFGIDLHIDDSEGVAEEGREHGFRVVVVSPTDAEWAARVLVAVDGIIQERK
jgi:FMN phosphatase YigB (HAD superfamily)